ncbi:MAG: hypothetical protein V4773_15855 [Verrucomicrobiota bacterium]
MKDPAPSPIDKLTIPGRLLLIFTIILFGAGFYFMFLFIANNRPSRSFPVIFISVPILMVCFFFFLIGGWLLERCGVQVYTHRGTGKD